MNNVNSNKNLENPEFRDFSDRHLTSIKRVKTVLFIISIELGKFPWCSIQHAGVLNLRREFEILDFPIVLRNLKLRYTYEYL